MRRRSSAVALRALILASFLASSSDRSWGQESPLPGPAEPGQIQRRFEPPAVPRSQEQPVVRPPREATEPPPNAAQIVFDLKGVVVDGATVFGPQAFLPLYEQMLGTTVSLLDVYLLAEQIAARYGEAGYVLTQAIVPPQRIREGIVRIQVIEGYINNIFIEGEVEGRSSILRDIATKIAMSRPLNIKDLERYVLLIDDLSGVTAQAVLKPAETIGAADLYLVLDHQKTAASLSIDNRGTRYLGPVQSIVGVDVNSALGLYERTSVHGVLTAQTDELKYFDVSQEHVVSAEGTRVRGQIARSYVNPGFRLKDSDIASVATTLSVDVSHPFVRSRVKNLTGGVRLDLRNIETDRNDGLTTISHDRVRALRGRFAYDFVDGFTTLPALNLIGIEASQGLEVLGARESGSANLSRAAGRSDFTKLALDVQRLQGLGGGFSLLLAATGQYGLSALLASEEFSFGGSQFGRGYDPSELTGDHGVGGKIELRYGGEVELPFLSGYQFYGFYDAGKVWNRDPAGTENPRSATSAGAGVRATFNTAVSGNLEVGVPLTGHVAAEGDTAAAPRVFFSLSGRY